LKRIDGGQGCREAKDYFLPASSRELLSLSHSFVRLAVVVRLLAVCDQDSSNCGLSKTKPWRMYCLVTTS